jgi:hypothetical protein
MPLAVGLQNSRVAQRRARRQVRDIDAVVLRHVASYLVAQLQALENKRISFLTEFSWNHSIHQIENSRNVITDNCFEPRGQLILSY